MANMNRLATLIVEEIKKEFESIHLSMNLVNSIKIYDNDGKLTIEIPAQMYDIKKYKSSGVIIYNRKGSYASEVDKSGGFSGKHTDYVNKCINVAINRWMKEEKINGKVNN